MDPYSVTTNSIGGNNEMDLFTGDMTDRCKLSVVKAMRVAYTTMEPDQPHPAVTTVNLLIGMTYCEGSLAYEALSEAGLVLGILAKAPPILDQFPPGTEFVPTDMTKAVYTAAKLEAKKTNQKVLGSDHLLLGILQTRCKAQDLLVSLGGNIVAIQDYLLSGLGERPLSPAYDAVRKTFVEIMSAGGDDSHIVQAVARVLRANNVPCE